MADIVTRKDIEEGLKALGLQPGDVAFVHSSLRSFGYVEGGAEAVVQTLLNVLGPEGTLVVPIFRRFFEEGEGDQVWDRETSPSLMGRISETARTWPGARRSYHAPHPIAAIGPLAEDLTERHNESDFSFESPFSRLLELNAWILLVGVSYNVCTMVHIIEERAEVPYRRWIDLAGTVVENGVAVKKSYPSLKRYPGVGNDFRPLGQLMEQGGLVNTGTIGKSTVRAFRSKDLYETGWGAVRRDPLFLVPADTEEEARKYLPKHGELLNASTEKKFPRLEPADPLRGKLARKLCIERPNGGPQVEIRKTMEGEDGLILEELRFSGGPSERIPGMLVIPKDTPGPLPAVICLHGTSGTWERLMEEPFVQRGAALPGWARELARRGFVTLAITQYSTPPRKEPWDWEWSKLLPAYGRTGMGRLVSDVVLCEEYLISRPEVDPERIGVSGFSLGGIVSFYSFAVDERLAAAAVFCGGVGSVRTVIREGSTRYHSAYYYIPGLLEEHLDHPELIRTLAPRPILVCGGTEDIGMPLSGLREFQDAAEREYGKRGVEDNIKMHMDEGPHAMTLRAFDAMAAWFGEKL